VLASDSLGKVPKVLFVALALMFAAAAAAYVLEPRHYLADDMAPMRLDEVAPQRIGEWQEDPAGRVVVADPQLQSKMDAIYSQSLARTYINSKGQRVMLSLAYGRDQNSESTAAHRPEFCYVAQGFLIKPVGPKAVAFPAGDVTAMRLVAAVGPRTEPIMYWVTLGTNTALPGVQRKIQQLRYGLQGQIVDGMLVRLSSVGTDTQSEYALQEAFARDWYASLNPQVRPRIFGS